MRRQELYLESQSKARKKNYLRNTVQIKNTFFAKHSIDVDAHVYVSTSEVYQKFKMSLRMSPLSQFLCDSGARPTRGTVHGAITSIPVHGGPGRRGGFLHASRGHFLPPLASGAAPSSPASLSPPIARFLPKSRENRRLTLAICADEEGEEAAERSLRGELGAGVGMEDMGPREAAACPNTRSEMERSRQALGKASEEGASQSARRRCFSFCVGSFGPIDIDSELVTLGANAEVMPEFRAPAVAIMALQAAIQGAEAWSEDCQGKRFDHARSGAPGHGAESCWSKEKPPRWRGPPTRALSPFSQEVQRANVRMSPMWNKLQKPPGFLGRDLRASQSASGAAGANGGRTRGFRNLVGVARQVFGGNEVVMGLVMLTGAQPWRCRPG